MQKYRWLFIKTTFIFFLPTLLTLRLFYLQVWKHRSVSQQVEKQLTTKVKINIPRGDILDRNNKILATSIEVAAVYINSRCFLEGQKFLKLNEIQQNYNLLSSIFNISKEELDKKCRQYTRFCLAKEVDISLAYTVKHIPGIDIETYFKRYYPYEEIASYVIGKVNLENKGYSGIEYEFDELLSSLKKEEIAVYKSGKVQKNPIRFVNVTDITKFVKNNRNLSIVLTIDIELQSRIESILNKFYDIYQPNLLSCIVQKSDTGEILVLSVLPSTSTPLVLPPIHYVYEPGSVFKIFNMAVLLEEGIVTKDTIIDCENGKFVYNGATIRDVKPHKYLSVEDIIVYSSNIGMAKLVLKLKNIKTLYEYLSLFGFGNLTGIEFTTEARGYLPSCDSLNSVIPIYISFGQGLAANMLQIVNGYTTIANNGLMLQPYIVKSIIDVNNRVIQFGQRNVIRKVISDKTAQILKEMLYQTVERGTAQGTKIQGIKICAKTGTAQKFDKKLNQYSPTKYLMSCCGFYPMEKPNFTIGVFVDEPKKGSLSSEVAVPIFKEIIKELVSYYNEVTYAKAN